MGRYSESARARETFKYAPSLVASTVIHQDATPRPSSDLVSSLDTSLTAFAQLAVVRIGVTRALVSLFDQDYQHVIAEATQASPLAASTGYDGQDGGFWLCGTAIPRAFSICEHVLHVAAEYSEEETELPVSVIPNLYEDERFSGKPYCRSPFYAGVPIRTARGIDIGVLCVFDDNTRASLDATSVRVLRDLSSTIAGHLASVRIKTNANRTQRMIRGISSFVEGKTTISGWKGGAAGPLFEDNPGQEGMLNAKQQDLESRDALRHGIDSPQSQEPQLLPSAPTQPAEAAEMQPTASIRQGPEAEPRPSSTPTAAPLPGISTTAPNPENVHIRRIFSRAANVLRESIEVEGVLFVDASVHSFGGLHKRDDGSGAVSGSEGFPSDSYSSEDGDGRGRSSPKLQGPRASILGFSTSERSSIDDVAAHSYLADVPEALLAKLLRRYPSGKIFNFDENGSIQSSDASGEESTSQPGDKAEQPPLSSPMREKRAFSRKSEPSAIIKIFPGARSVALIPLWDTQKQRWFAGGFAFTREPTRVFTVEGEVSYLRAFGMTAMSEISRADVMIADRAKSDALSSLSHELRSPLHGLLLGTDLLSDTKLDVFQGNTLHTVETCGRTLLDTIDHLLYYSKINNFMNTSSQRRHTGGARGLRNDRAKTIEAGMSSLSTDAHLDLIAEEVIDSLYFGYSFQQVSLNKPSHQASFDTVSPLQRLNLMYVKESAQEPQITPRSAEAPLGEIAISLDIDPHCSWLFHVQPGAIRRILMNLFGNSLKYTTKGSITVSLHQDALPTSRNRNSRRVVRIVVEDTGKGISDDYLQNHLFQPFTQENHLEPGVGLGLSLVKRVTTSLGGTVKLESLEGRGTKVTVSIPMLPASPASPEDSDLGLEADFAARVSQLAGLRVLLCGFEDDEDTKSQQSASESRARRKWVERTCQDWLRMQVVAAEDVQRLVPDIILCTEAGLEALLEREDGKYLAPTITVCNNVLTARQVSTALTLLRKRGVFEFISQPIGPRKLAKALLLCFNRWTDAQPDLSIADGKSPVLSANKSEANIPSFTTLSWTAPQNITEKPGELLSLDESPIASPFESQPTSSPSSHSQAQSIEPKNGLEPHTRNLRPTLSRLQHTHDHPKLETAPSTPTKNFLLVDDNMVNIQILVAYMKKLGYAYTTAMNGKEAYDAYSTSSGQFDCILMDISMPVMNGFESSRLIRTFEREQQLTPSVIIALTGLASVEAQQEAFAIGIDLFLTKPVRFKEMSQILSEKDL